MRKALALALLVACKPPPGETASLGKRVELLNRQADADRRARLEAAGFVVVRVSETDVWHYPDEVVEQVRAGRNEAHLRVLQGVVAPRTDLVGATR